MKATMNSMSAEHPDLEFTVGAAVAAATEDRPSNIPDTGEKQVLTGAPALTQPAARELHQSAILSHPRRGRTPRKLPLQRVRRLAAEGLGSRKIAERLQGEGIDASYRTVARCSRIVGWVMPM